MELFRDGTKIVFVVPLKHGDPEAGLRRAIRKVCGKNFQVLDPELHKPEYERALTMMRSRLQYGEHVICWDKKEMRLSFYTPKRQQKAWSAWLRIVDISAVLYN
jgi:hypothetical protein